MQRKKRNFHSFTGSIVRQYDPDRYFLSLFSPVDKREALWALLAFNHEIAKTREVVSETQLGLIRLQWWREEIGKIYDTCISPQNEILQALCLSIHQYDLKRQDFENLIYGREFDLEGVLPSTTDGTLSYIEATNMPLMALMCQVLGIKQDKNVAINFGLVGLLRALPFHASQQRCYLPENLLRDYDINEYSLYSGRDIEKLSPVVEILMGHFKDTKVASRALKAMQHWATIYADYLRSYNYDVFQMANAPPPKFKELRCYIATLL